MRKKKIVLGFLSAMMVTVTVAAAAWILQANSQGNTLGVKAKHLELSTDGGATFDVSAPAFWIMTDIDMDLGTQTFDQDFYLKTTKNITDLTLTVTNLVRTQDGNPWPAECSSSGGVSDIANHFGLFLNTVWVGEIDDLADVPYAFSFIDTDSDRTSDLYAFTIRANDAMLGHGCNNSGAISFDVYIDDVTP